jgi:hypothetical protein
MKVRQSFKNVYDLTLFLSTDTLKNITGNYVSAGEV